jgi:two-component system sensor histidine kinase KdpD
VTTVIHELDSGRRGHVIRIDIPEDLPPIDVDIALVNRVLTNLLENAIRHSPRGTPITIRATLIDQDRIEVSVSDLGIGVSPQRRNEIFEVFARRNDDAGAGLGLTIAKTFIEAHGQRIWVDDAPEGGARFCFTLPLAAPLPEESKLVAHPHH